MLHHLQIENYALIEQAGIDFGPGFNVLTGETGSGKSIIVDALGLILGQRAEAEAIRSGASRATVSGSFSSPFVSAAAAAAWCEANGLSELGGEIRLRREVAAEGRSRAFIDHQLATVGLLRELAGQLGEIHSQHESLISFTPAAQLQLLDRFAATGKETVAIAAAYAAWAQCAAREQESQAQERLRLQQADLWRFQAEEIDSARPQPGEDGALEAERLRLANAEKIAAAAAAAYDALYEGPHAAATQLKAALRQVQELERFEPILAAARERLEALRVEAADVAELVRSATGKTEASPARLGQVEERLLVLERLQRKYGPGLTEVLAFRQELAVKLETVDHAEAYQARARAETEAAAAVFHAQAEALTQKRRAAAKRLSRKVEVEVADLAMKIQFQVEFTPAEWSPSGSDRVQFLASTNPGEPLLPVAEIASGGELSRLLLALHIAAPGGEKTLVLDEVDAGIGGRAAEAVGKKLQRLGENYQVLCVTHLAQIASYASHHLLVEKAASAGRTRTQVRTLAPAERVQEVARMLAGSEINATALRHARELLSAHAADAR